MNSEWTAMNFESESADLDSFQRLIEFYAGIHIKQRDRPKLENAIEERMALCGINHMCTYFRHIVPVHKKKNSELNALISLIVNTESFFFRDKHLFQALKTRILPEIIRGHREDRLIKIWSAGASRGEEIYSIAILLSEILPNLSDWKILLFGSDIDQKSIDIAMRGVFSDWSIRSIDSHYLEKYFTRSPSGWVIRDHIKQMVSFTCGNLITERYPSFKHKIKNIDLIMCRNVFIYFSTDAIRLVVEKFYHTLNDHGILITGHNELREIDLDNFKMQQMNHFTFYKKGTGS